MDFAHRRELFSLDPRVAHLNHGSFGAVPIPVQRAQQRLRDEMDANPMAFFSRGLLDRLAHTRRHLAAFVGADPDGVALVPNATAAVMAVLSSVAFAPGQEVLVTDHGYGAVRIAAEQVAGRAGATVREVAVPLTATDDEILDRRDERVGPRAHPARRHRPCHLPDREAVPGATGSWPSCATATCSSWSTPRTGQACSRWTWPAPGPTSGSATCTSGRTRRAPRHCWP